MTTTTRALLVELVARHAQAMAAVEARALAVGASPEAAEAEAWLWLRGHLAEVEAQR